MELLDIIGRSSPPEPWAEGDNIPWHEPGFSARMLHEHLSQEHDAASRRSGTIDRQIAWIHKALLGERPARILDLGCGPGLYSSRLARLGHQCVGIDYSPASIAYARAEAEVEGLACQYVLSDIREAELGAEFDLAMLIFGELNIFRPGHAAALLARVRDALAPGGILLLEAHTYGAVQRIGEGAPAWTAATAGLFSDRPHLCLTEQFWHPEASAATTRFYVVDAASGEVSRYAQSFQAYTEEGYAALGRECGFSKVTFLPSLTGGPVADGSDLLVMVVQL